MVPPAPPRFSTSTGWPIDSCMRCATMRAAMSVVPPAGNGTMMRRGLYGKDCGRTAPLAAASSSKSRNLYVTDVQDFIAFHPSRRLGVDDVAGLLADQRARDRRIDRDAALLDVGLVVADDLVGRRRLALFFQVHGGAEHAAPFRIQQLRVDDLRVAELRLQLGDAPLDEALLRARRFVLGVLRQVAVRARLGDRGDHAWAIHGLEALQFHAQQLRAANRHWGFGHGSEFSAVWRAVPAAGRVPANQGPACPCRRPARRRWWCSR